LASSLTISAVSMLRVTAPTVLLPSMSSTQPPSTRLLSSTSAATVIRSGWSPSCPCPVPDAAHGRLPTRRHEQSQSSSPSGASDITPSGALGSTGGSLSPMPICRPSPTASPHGSPPPPPPPPLPVGAPERCPSLEWCFIHRSEDIITAEDMLELALVMIIGGNRAPVSIDQVRHRILEHYGHSRQQRHNSALSARRLPHHFLIL
jgi:hypothetical protein